LVDMIMVFPPNLLRCRSEGKECTSGTYERLPPGTKCRRRRVASRRETRAATDIWCMRRAMCAAVYIGTSGQHGVCKREAGSLPSPATRPLSGQK
jgi:hypothetical protein